MPTAALAQVLLEKDSLTGNEVEAVIKNAKKVLEDGFDVLEIESRTKQLESGLPEAVNGEVKGDQTPESVNGEGASEEESPTPETAVARTLPLPDGASDELRDSIAGNPDRIKTTLKAMGI